MPRPRGTPKTGGRTAGTPNKDKAELLAMIREHIGDAEFHPVLAMAEMATATETTTEKGKKVTVHKYPLATREAMLKEIAQYVAPKLKAIEHSAGEDGLGLNLHMHLGPPPKKGNSGSGS